MRLKKLVTILMTVALMATMLPMMVFADSGNSQVAYATIKDGVMTIGCWKTKPESAYEMPNFTSDNTYKDIPWFKECENVTKVILDPTIKDFRPTSVRYWFYGMENLVSIDNLEYLNTEKVTDMAFLFCDCYLLESVNLSNFNTSNVTDMESMFYWCLTLESIDVSTFDTSKVTNMNYMFSQCCDCENGKHYGNSLKSIIFGNKWDMSNVTTIGRMFSGCFGLTELDVSDWNTSNIVSFYCAFECCSGLETLDVSNWDTSKAEDVNFMFEDCFGLKSIDVSNWDTSNVVHLNTIFSGCSQLETVDLSSFDITDIPYVNSLFYGCANLKTIYVNAEWELSEYAKYGSGTGKDMFRGCVNLVGGAGTTYDKEIYAGTINQVYDRKYAVIDGGPDNPGYLTLKMCTVEFTGGEGTTGTVPTPITEGAKKEITLPSSSSLSKSGYKFAGWSDGKSVYAAGDQYKLGNKDITFTAQWECLHEHTEIKNAKKATTSAEGYTGDTCCTTCGEVLKSGEAIPSLTPEPTPSGDPSGNPTPTTNPTTNPTPTIEPTPTKDPDLDVGDFVDRCYDVALGREADEAGYDSWKSQLNNGQACGAQVGYGFIFSPEYILKDTSNEQFVKDLYTMFFDREPDEGGFNYWVGMLNDGTAGREQVFAGFANSVEFYELCLKYGVVAGYYVVGVNNEQQGGVNSFVARLYKVCLNRMPDQGGQAGWVIKLMNGEVTGTTCAYGFVFSPEFIGKEPSNSEFVNYMYAAFFGRAADEDGLNYWVSQLDGGTASREDIFSGFAGSIEFANLCAGYGINA